MKLAIMQPYFFPYIGYFQLINAVDEFIVYDNIKYTKKGWINRNRLLQNGKDAMFSLPLQSASDFLDVRDRELAPDFPREKLLNRFKDAYRHAPFFRQTFRLIEEVVLYDHPNLFRFLHHSIARTCAHLGIATPLTVSSAFNIDHSLKGQEKVLALCRAAGAETYINAIGGLDLYAKQDFQNQGVGLTFIRPRPFEYMQFGASFVPWLSIVDVMMFNSPEQIGECLASNYDLI
ncbi:MAG: WbqC family protein [Rhodocyclaceae bacterium]|nr:WbqC family protein [Rhodocyclaceae bacterium]